MVAGMSSTDRPSSPELPGEKKKGKSKHPRKETCEGLNKVVLSFVPHGP